MITISVPYGDSAVTCEIPGERLKGVLYSQAYDYKAKVCEHDLVCEALNAPINSPSLRDLAKGKNRVAVITSDHTRPVPSRITMPLLLEEIRVGNPSADIAILVATGMHRIMTQGEIADRFGPKISSSEKIFVHDCHDESNLISLGTLPSGGELILNRRAV